MRNLDRKLCWTDQGFWYEGGYRELSEEAILLDGGWSEETDRPHVYRDIREAFSSPELSQASPERPVTMYIAPNVYWIDDPKATDTMQKREGYPVPFGMYVVCKALRIIGLSEQPEDVVIAGNRGQSHACNGNYTMLHLQVEDLSVSNITLGNYCSVDLVYPLNHELDYPKRTETVTQAQLALQQGDRLYAKNCRFISRLNLNPICGAERALYENCHFESTDDALNGNAVYVGCDFDFYGSRPIFQAKKTGVVFIDCLFRSRIKDRDAESWQYLTKEGGPVTLIDCRYESGRGINLGWTKYPEAALKCYQHHVSKNGQPVILGGRDAPETVQLQGKKALEAYIFEQDGKRCVNVGNLLGGSDGWNPTGMLELAQKAGKTGIPTLLRLFADQTTVISGRTEISLKAEAYLFSQEPCKEKVSFSLRAEDEKYVKLHQNADGSCTAEGCNHGTEAKKVMIHAFAECGLEAAAAVVVEPYLLQAPAFVQAPRLQKAGKTVTLHYELSSGERADASEISWYRCDSADGEGAVLCGVSKRGIPLKTYRLKAADEGKYIRAVILPKVTGSLSGKAETVFMTESVREEDVERNYVFTDFSDMPDENQTVVRKGSWTLDCAKPADIEIDSAAFGSFSMDGSIPAWKYGETGNGSMGAGLYQNTQGARLRYTPSADCRGDMSMTVRVDPAKTAGQGFGSAGQYLDLGIKFDTEKLTGYALRIIRVKEASDAVAMALVKYQNGRSSCLTGLQLTSCFLTGCTIRVALKGRRLCASAVTETPQPDYKAEKGYAQEIYLETEVEGNSYGGILVWHTGTPGTGGWQNTTMLHSIEARLEVCAADKAE